MSPETTMLALLFWHLDASESELKQINVSRDDVIRLARTFEYELPEGRREELTAIGRSMLVAYRHGQMDGPREVAAQVEQPSLASKIYPNPLKL